MKIWLMQLFELICDKLKNNSTTLYTLSLLLSFIGVVFVPAPGWVKEWINDHTKRYEMLRVLIPGILFVLAIFLLEKHHRRSQMLELIHKADKEAEQNSEIFRKIAEQSCVKKCLKYFHPQSNDFLELKRDIETFRNEMSLEYLKRLLDSTGRPINAKHKQLLKEYKRHKKVFDWLAEFRDRAVSNVTHERSQPLTNDNEAEKFSMLLNSSSKSKCSMD